jgi:hypothetical protein
MKSYTYDPVLSITSAIDENASVMIMIMILSAAYGLCAMIRAVLKNNTRITISLTK